MKLLRLKITDPQGFRSLQSGFEYVFRTDWVIGDEFSNRPQFTTKGFSPFVCAGPNGSGKSNLLEALAAIFFQLEILRVRRSFLPEAIQEDMEFYPCAYELDYLIEIPEEYRRQESHSWASVSVWKEPGQTVRFIWNNQHSFDVDFYETFKGGFAEILLPQFVLGYSSGENEILSLPFFKMRFIQFDEYWNSLRDQLAYPGRPESRLAYMDNSFSQAILLCNLLYDGFAAVDLFSKDMGLKELLQFRIIIKRSVHLTFEQAEAFGLDHPALLEPYSKMDVAQYSLNIIDLLEADEQSSDRFDPPITRLKRCATCYFEDEQTDTLYLDFYVNEATKAAFADNFNFAVNKSPIELFQVFQVLLSLNLYTVSDPLKKDLYQSNSLYVNETIPTLASDERIMRFKNFYFRKEGIDKPVLLKSLSDGEHQLLHSLGLCLLFKDTNSLFLLDEPETHFNPAWRSNFISRLRACFGEEVKESAKHEMLITTHTPFLISDSESHKVLIFNKNPETNQIEVTHPEYNTLGASINKITMETFNKRETIGGYAQSLLDEFREEFKKGGADLDELLKRIDHKLGDSVDKLLLMKTIIEANKEKQ